MPNNNRLWVRIHVKAGIYNEKVSIQQEKQYIVLEGENRETTVITWDAGGDVIESTTFTMLADNFVARDITFQNTYNLNRGKKRNITWAPAAMVAGDKVSFYRCGFFSVQDTLSDVRGGHYYDSCHIQGATDFIWGNAQSFFYKCYLDVASSLLGADDHDDLKDGRRGGRGHYNEVVGYITAQGRERADENSGFVFSFCNVIGTGPALLGRAYRNYSRVVYYKTHMDDIISPEGWNPWFNAQHVELITYAEVECFGPGSDMSKRVKWEKQSRAEELKILIDVNSFINQDAWLGNQPISG